LVSLAEKYAAYRKIIPINEVVFISRLKKFRVSVNNDCPKTSNDCYKKLIQVELLIWFYCDTISNENLLV